MPEETAITTKRCPHCGLTKDITSEFYKGKRNRGSSWCRQCYNSRLKDPEFVAKVKARAKEYRKRYPEKCKETTARWRLKNREYSREYHRKLRQRPDQKEKYKIYKKKYYKAHKAIIDAQRKGYYLRYRNSKYHTDTAFRIENNLRNRIFYALRACGALKADRCMSLTGCDPDQLKTHLESTFTEGMSWDLKGQLHIDHIVPCCSFDLTKPDEQRKCFHYTNLRMMWAKDNIKKGHEDRHKSIRRALNG